MNWRNLVRMGELLKYCQCSGFTPAQIELALDQFDDEISRASVTSISRARDAAGLDTLPAGGNKFQTEEDVCEKQD